MDRIEFESDAFNRRYRVTCADPKLASDVLTDRDDRVHWVNAAFTRVAGWTLAEVAGADWTPDLQAAWAEAYGAIVSLMLAPAVKATG